MQSCFTVEPGHTLFGHSINPLQDFPKCFINSGRFCLLTHTLYAAESIKYRTPNLDYHTSQTTKCVGILM